MKTLHIAIMILIVALSVFGIFLFTQLQFTHEPELTYIVRQILPDDEIEKDPGMVTIQNQTFHILTINKITFNSNNSTEIDWYGIKFSFPHGLKLTNSTDGKFIESYVTFPGESVSNKMTVAQGFVAFSTHHDPQVGILLDNETVKLLVNWTKIYSDLAIIGLNETYKTGQPIDFQIRVGGFDYFDEGAIPKIWVERQDGSIAWSPPHKDSIVLCCAPEFTDYDRKFNLTDLGGPITIDKSGSYHLTVQYADQKIQKQFSVIPSQVTKQSKTVNATTLQCENEFKPRETQHVTFPNGTSLTTIYTPVFLMKSNSTGKICITNNIASQSTDQSSISAKTTSRVSKDDSETSDVIVVPYPENIVVDNTTKTIVYTITTSNVANGFYRISTTFDFCGSGIPLAVGYNSSHLFDNDFPWLGQTLPCPFNSFQSVQTQITGLTGIDVAYITKEYR